MRRRLDPLQLVFAAAGGLATVGWLAGLWWLAPGLFLPVVELGATVMSAGLATIFLVGAVGTWLWLGAGARGAVVSGDRGSNQPLLPELDEDY